MLIAAIFATVVALTFGVLLVLQRTARGGRQVGQPGPTAEPECSPVAWISDAVWQQLHPAPVLNRRIAAERPMLIGPQIVEATAADRRRAPITPDTFNPGIPPPKGSPTRQHQRLLDTPGHGRINLPVWPICCERLGTLVSRQNHGLDLEAIENQTGPLDQAFLEGELSEWGHANHNPEAVFAQGWSEILNLMRAGEHKGQGMHIYHCRGCMRIYVASCAP